MVARTLQKRRPPMKYLAFIGAFLTMFTGKIVFAENFKPLLFALNVLTGDVEEGLAFLYLDESTLAPIVEDVIEADPFGRDDLNEYVETTVSCQVDLFLYNGTGQAIAFRDPFATVVRLNFISPEGNLSIQGNLGMSAASLDTGNSFILKEEQIAKVNFVSMTSRRFQSRLEAADWIDAGGCDFKSAIRVDMSSTGGQIMFDNDEDWTNFAGSFSVFISSD